VAAACRKEGSVVGVAAALVIETGGAGDGGWPWLEGGRAGGVGRRRR
jgi:hypothetical protein